MRGMLGPVGNHLSVLFAAAKASRERMDKLERRIEVLEAAAQIEPSETSTPQETTP